MSNLPRFIHTDESRALAAVKTREHAENVRMLYKLDYSPDVEELWKILADKRNVKLPKHNHPKASKLIKFAKAIGLETEDWKEGLFGSYYKNSLQKAIDLYNSKLPDGQKESLRTKCCYILEGNYKC